VPSAFLPAGVLFWKINNIKKSLHIEMLSNSHLKIDFEHRAQLREAEETRRLAAKERTASFMGMKN
jgi:hypothetical protein